MERDQRDKGLDKLLSSMAVGTDAEEHLSALVNSIVEFYGDDDVFGYKNHMFVWTFNPQQGQSRQEVQTRLLAATADVIHEMNNRLQACHITKKVDLELHQSKTMLDLLLQRAVYEIYSEDGIYAKLGSPIPGDQDTMTEEEQADVLNNRPMLAIYIHVHHRLETNCWYVGFSLLCQQTERVGHEEYMITETEELVGAEFALF